MTQQMEMCGEKVIDWPNQLPRKACAGNWLMLFNYRADLSINYLCYLINFIQLIKTLRTFTRITTQRYPTQTTHATHAKHTTHTVHTAQAMLAHNAQFPQHN